MNTSKDKKEVSITDEKGNLTTEYLEKIVEESIKQNPIVYQRLAKI